MNYREDGNVSFYRQFKIFKKLLSKSLIPNLFCPVYKTLLSCMFISVSFFYLLLLHLVLCRVGALKVSPNIIHCTDYILFSSFEISKGILRNQKLIIGLDTFSNQY